MAISGGRSLVMALTARCYDLNGPLLWIELPVINAYTSREIKDGMIFIVFIALKGGACTSKK